MGKGDKDRTLRDKKYLAFIRKHRCCVCGAPSSDYMSVVPAHQTLDSHGFMGGKASDYRAVPLCSNCHRLEHMKGARTFWRDYYRELIIIRLLEEYISEQI